MKLKSVKSHLKGCFFLFLWWELSVKKLEVAKVA